MPEQWQDSLLALKPEFELGASRWPDLRCFVVVGPDSVRHEVLRDLDGRSDHQTNLRCSYVVGRQFSESESSATRPDAGRDLVKQLLHVLAGRRATHLRDGPSVICDERWLVGLCGDRDGADNFEMTALAAAGCYGVPDAWPFDAGIIPRPDLRRNELSTGLWIEMMFRVAWEQRTGLTLRACKFARSQGWHGAFFSVLPLNPFLASALFVNLMVIQLELQREGATAELLRQKPEIAELAGLELQTPERKLQAEVTESNTPQVEADDGGDRDPWPVLKIDISARTARLRDKACEFKPGANWDDLKKLGKNPGRLKAMDKARVSRLRKHLAEKGLKDVADAIQCDNGQYSLCTANFEVDLIEPE